MNLDFVFENNKKWVNEKLSENANYFDEMGKGQSPELLYIGCSDSRVSAEDLMGLGPGEVFVHRNIANMVIGTDLNAMSVVEYAVMHLKVDHIVVCGHYGCGGVKAASQNHHLGLIDNWLRHIRDVRQKHDAVLRIIGDDDERLDRLCELNVVEQAHNVCHTTVVQEAWENGQDLAIHGWIYRIQDGLIRDMNVTIAGPDEIADAYKVAINRE